jgi:hypothetical protein
VHYSAPEFLTCACRAVRGDDRSATISIAKLIYVAFRPRFCPFEYKIYVISRYFYSVQAKKFMGFFYHVKKGV